ncbi:MAG: hypothetical protein LBK66_03480 [Spirochaetaceae bacterium]|jgi:hypothetical protein|nr:hypothetical protein [Spirochaetaceae bacterium]
MLSVTVEDIKKIGQVKEMLTDCSTEAAIDNVFNQFSITDLPVKTMLLRQSMQVQEVFGSPGDESLSDEDIYREELEFFLDGKWRDLV